MKTPQLPEVNWCELYGKLAEAVDHHGYSIVSNDKGYIDLMPKVGEVQGIDLGQFIALAKFGEEFAFSAEKQPHSRVVYSQASRLLALIDQRDAAKGVSE